MSFGIEVKGVKKMMNKLERYPHEVDKELDYTVKAFGESLRLNCVRHASGPPGPMIQTGAYVAEMTVEIRRKGVVVYNNSPQAARLEYGFYGADSLGRVYHQPPFPHMRPALFETFAEYWPVFKDIPTNVWERM